MVILDFIFSRRFRLLTQNKWIIKLLLATLPRVFKSSEGLNSLRDSHPKGNNLRNLRENINLLFEILNES